MIARVYCRSHPNALQAAVSMSPAPSRHSRSHSTLNNDCLQQILRCIFGIYVKVPEFSSHPFASVLAIDCSPGNRMVLSWSRPSGSHYPNDSPQHENDVMHVPNAPPPPRTTSQEADDCLLLLDQLGHCSSFPMDTQPQCLLGSSTATFSHLRTLHLHFCFSSITTLAGPSFDGVFSSKIDLIAGLTKQAQRWALPRVQTPEAILAVRCCLVLLHYHFLWGVSPKSPVNDSPEGAHLPALSFAVRTESVSCHSLHVLRFSIHSDMDDCLIGSLHGGFNLILSALLLKVGSDPSFPTMHLGASTSQLLCSVPLTHHLLSTEHLWFLWAIPLWWRSSEVALVSYQVSDYPLFFSILGIHAIPMIHQKLFVWQ